MGPPADRCGYAYTGETGNESCCYRETWGERDRCVWHEDAADDETKPADALRAARVAPSIREANSGSGPRELLDGIDVEDAALPENIDLMGVSLRDATLAGTDLRRATLTDADLRDSDFTDADLRGATLAGADLWEADLTDAYLPNADLSGADLREADCSDASFQGATLAGARLEQAFFDRADLFEATLTDTDCYGAVFSDARINEGTALDETCPYDPAGDGDYDPDDDGVDRLTKAEATYQELASLCAENALLNQQSRYFVRRQDIHTAEHRREGRWGRWLRARVSRAVVLYGESPFRVLSVAAAVIVGTALLYPLGYLRSSATGQLLTYPSPTEPVALLATLADSLYFSTLTFTTMTFGLYAPVGAGKFLTMVETGAGIVLMALLVFVFGRRATR